MKKALQNEKDNKEVVQLTFTQEEAKELEWEEESEFCFKGDMYDVVEKTERDNHVIIRCIPDTKETALLNEYQKHNKQYSSNSTTVELLTVQFVLPANLSLNPEQIIIQKRFSDYLCLLQNPSLKISSPPPDVYLSLAHI